MSPHRPPADSTTTRNRAHHTAVFTGGACRRAVIRVECQVADRIQLGLGFTLPRPHHYSPSTQIARLFFLLFGPVAASRECLCGVRRVLVPPRVVSGEGGVQKLTRRHDTDAMPAARGKVPEIAGDEECSVGGDRHFQKGPVAGVG